MTTRALTCPKCSAAMEPGVFADHAHYGMPVPLTWLAGEATKGRFGGEKMPKGREVKVTTWRCTGCGYLESYAVGKKTR